MPTGNRTARRSSSDWWRPRRTTRPGWPRLTAELAGRLAERVDADVRWTVREGWGAVARAATVALRR
ncbi:hypothetical protein B0E54_04511 [Micromonospora sp. MH99]|nr:hypothetical protein [Micromonospora sp. MH99]